MGFESAHNYILPDPDKTPEEQEELYRNVDHNMRAADLREKLATVQRETAEEEKARDRRVSNELAEEDRRDPTGEARAARAREVAQATAARIRWDAGEEERTRQTRAEERRQEAMAPEVEAARERDRRIAEDARTIRRIEQEERRGDWTEADREHGRMEGERRDARERNVKRNLEEASLERKMDSVRQEREEQERARDKRVAAELRKEKEDDPDGSKRLERARQDARGRGIREAFGEALELQRQEEERARRKTEEFWESPEGRRITAERKEEADRRAQEREDREQEGYTQRAEALRREKAPEERQRELIAERLPVDPDRFDDLIDELERRGAVVGEDLPYDRFKDQMRTVRARAEHALKYPTAEHKKALDETAERVRSKVHELARKYGVDLNHYNGPSEGQLEEAA